jgi:hypothetical protein
VFSKTTLPHDLVQAYRETHYTVPPPDALTLRVDQPNPGLARAQQRYRVDCSAFITACNPGSTELSARENANRQADLAAELQSLGFCFVAGLGKHPTNGWPGEPSFLVFGLSLETATTLCNRYGQNGFIWCGADGLPKLVLTK